MMGESVSNGASPLLLLLHHLLGDEFSALSSKVIWELCRGYKSIPCH